MLEDYGYFVSFVCFKYLQAMKLKKDRAKLIIIKVSRVSQGMFLSTGQSPDHVCVM